MIGVLALFAVALTVVACWEPAGSEGRGRGAKGSTRRVRVPVGVSRYVPSTAGWDGHSWPHVDPRRPAPVRGTVARPIRLRLGRRSLGRWAGLKGG
jgi:hypothetical protein